MFGVVAALFDEVYEVISQLEPSREGGTPHYVGTIAGRDVKLFLCRPGFQRKKEFANWVSSNHFEALINIGFAGALLPEFAIGDICRAAPLRGDSTAEGLKIAKASRPIFGMDEKLDLHYKTGAQLVDMESHAIADFLKKSNIKVDVFFIKIVGDILGDESYLHREVDLRGYFSSFGFFRKLKIVLKAGPMNFLAMYRKKRFLQKRLNQALVDFVSGRQAEGVR